MVYAFCQHAYTSLLLVEKKEQMADAALRFPLVKVLILAIVLIIIAASLLALTDFGEKGA